MKNLTILLLCLGVSTTTMGEVSTEVRLANAYTPLAPIDPSTHLYPDIMVGTKLTIIVNSDSNEYWRDGGSLTIEEAYWNCGALSARDFNDTTFDWEGSRFPAAGHNAAVWDWEEPGIDGFDLYTGSRDIEAGKWFLIDYTAKSIGDCNVGFYDHSIDWLNPIYYLQFSHVATRNFNYDTTVDFGDFALLAFCWQAADSNDPNWCEAADLDSDGRVGSRDLGLFVDYWLETTEPNVRPPDFDEDANVDSIDFTILAQYWQATNCRNPDWCEGADLDYDHIVDVRDLRSFAKSWLKVTRR